jgi:hypothetical protein
VLQDVVDSLNETGSCCGMEMNVGKNKAVTVLQLPIYLFSRFACLNHKDSTGCLKINATGAINFFINN